MNRIKQAFRAVATAARATVAWIRRHPRLACLIAGFVGGLVTGALL